MVAKNKPKSKFQKFAANYRRTNPNATQADIHRAYQLLVVNPREEAKARPMSANPKVRGTNKQFLKSLVRTKQMFNPMRSFENALKRADIGEDHVRRYKELVGSATMLPPLTNFQRKLLFQSINLFDIARSDLERVASIGDFDMKTFIATTYHELVMTGSNSTVSSGEFSCLIQPHMGDDLALQYNKFIVPDPTKFGLNFGDITNYLAVIDDDGLSIDQQLLPLLNPAMLRVTLLGNTAQTPALPLGTAPTYSRDQPRGTKFGYNPATGDISVPAGQFEYVVYLVGTGFASDITVVNSGLTLAAASEYKFFSTTEAMFRAEYASSSGGTIRFSITGTTVTSADVAISTSPNGQIYNTGIVSNIKFVGMNVWFEFSSSIINAGRVSCSQVPPGSLTLNYLTQNPSTTLGQLQNFGALAKSPEAYKGDIHNGCYAVYRHTNAKQSEYFKPSKVRDTEFPSIIVSGYCNDENGAGVTNEIGVVKVQTVYEINSLWQLFAQSYPYGNAADTSAVNKWLEHFSGVLMMENSKHRNIISSIIGEAGKVGNLVQNAANAIDSFMDLF